MIVSLDPTFLQLPDNAFQGYSKTLEYLLFRHSEHRILLALTPAIIAKIRKCANIGPLADAVLNSIADKYLDYLSMVRISRSLIRVLPDDSDNLREVSDRIFEARQGDVKDFLDVAPRFYLENAPNDGGFYRLVIDSYLVKKKIPTHLCSSESFHGGGNTLGAAMKNSESTPLVGLCICDRDTGDDAPPFPKNTTGEAAFAAAVEKKSVSGGIPAVSLHPFFSIMPTHGWSIENYIGPNLLDAFFQNNPDAYALRDHFVSSFPSFPKLSPVEAKEWFVSHFKAQQDGGDVLSSFDRFFGKKDNARCIKLARLQVPDSALGWIIDNARGTRYSGCIAKAMQLDLDMDQYSQAVRELSEIYISIFAADKTARFI